MDKNTNRRATVLRPLIALTLCSLWTTSRVAASDPSVNDEQSAKWEYSAITTLRNRFPDDDVSPQLVELHKAAAASRPVAQFTLGCYYYEGKWVEKDETRGLELIRTAAGRGLAAAQSYLGWVHFKSMKSAVDAREAERWLIAAARQGDAYATSTLAHLYLTDLLGKKDPDFVTELFERSAELTDNRARLTIAWRLLHGPDVKRDPRTAEYFLLKAAQTNDAEAAYRLGTEYLVGAALKRDLERGAHWLGEASKQGHTLAKIWLSDLIARGIGVTKDPEYAQHLLTTALGSASIEEKNYMAWYLAVNPREELRNPDLALQILKPALANDNAPRASHLDSLAAAYAAVGQFEQAVITQQRAIDLARKQNHAELENFQARLELYKGREAFYEISP